MALITCTECSQQISSDATACPHCGKPSGKPTTQQVRVTQPAGPWTVIGWIILLAIGIPLVSCVMIAANIAARN